MKILAFGDIQVYPYSEFSKETSGNSTRLLDLCLSTFGWIEQLVVEGNPDVVVCLGDVFDRANPIDVRSLMVVYESLMSLKRRKPVHVLLGNHDIWSSDGAVHALSFLGDLVVDAGIKTYQYDIPLTFINYSNYCEHLSADLDKFDWSQVGYIFSHNAIKGYCYNGITEKVGLDLEKLSAVLPPHRSSVKMFHGHYHEPDEFTTGKVQSIVVGAPFARSFADAHELGSSPARGAVFIDNDKVYRLQNPHAWVFETASVFNELSLSMLETGLKAHGSDKLFLRVSCPEELTDATNKVLSYAKLAGFRLRVVPKEAIRETKLSEHKANTSPEDLIKSTVESEDNLGALDGEKLVYLGNAIVQTTRRSAK